MSALSGSTQKMHIRELEYVPHRAEVHKNALLLVYSFWFIGKVSSSAAFPRLYTIHHTLAFRLSPITYTLSTTSIANSLSPIAQSPKTIPCTICRTSAHTFQAGVQLLALHTACREWCRAPHGYAIYPATPCE